ncbi:MAG: hypothetical protein H7A09_07000 [Oceanospirillaceae bacterium]|nr:hypothetical protein [Oceanospirillaceae bacterium]
MANALGAGCIDSTGPSLKNSSVQGCFATVAIDLPLHGIAPLPHGDGTADPFACLSWLIARPWKHCLTDHSQPCQSVTAKFIAADAENTAKADPNLCGLMTLKQRRMVAFQVIPGSMFINVSNFQVSRDNMRQAVMDLSQPHGESEQV